MWHQVINCDALILVECDKLRKIDYCKGKAINTLQNDSILDNITNTKDYRELVILNVWFYSIRETNLNGLRVRVFINSIRRHHKADLIDRQELHLDID